MRTLIAIAKSSLCLAIVFGCFSCTVAQPPKVKAKASKVENTDSKELAKATFGGGCFWCVEAVFENMKGVKEVISGYEGGTVKNPTYQQVCTKLTGHAEVCQIIYDPEVVDFKDLLAVFWKTHDPTTLNRQGNDYGPQYRSVIFYHDDEQRKIAEEYKEKLDKSGAFRSKIVTEITKTEVFYPAEDYHQDYFRKNPADRYCNAVARPKIEKFKKIFPDKVADPKDR